MPASSAPLWVLIPAKTTLLSKKRLSPVLNDAERISFTRWLLTSLLATLEGTQLHLAPLLLTSDPLLATLAAPYGYPTLPDPPHADLNAVLEAGRSHAIQQGASQLLILPTDLPYLTSAALHTFLAHAETATPTIVIAPDRDGSGTNALLLRPADAIPFRFGIGSAALHRAEAQKRGIPLHEYRDPALAQDIDLPEHYRQLQGVLGVEY